MNPHQSRLNVRDFVQCGKIKGVKYQLIVVASADGKGNNISPFEIENSAEIQLLAAAAVLHFRHIGEPLLIRLLGCEVSIKDVFCSYLRRGTLVFRILATNNGFQPHKLCKPVKSLVIVTRAISGIVFVRQPPIAIYAVKFCVKCTYFVQECCVFKLPMALFSTLPLVIAGAVQLKYFANL